jgi:AraC-like DNA-binding protein
MPRVAVAFDQRSSHGLRIRHVACEADCRETFVVEDGCPAIGYNFCLQGDLECVVSTARFRNRVRGDCAGMWRQTGAPVVVTLEKGRHAWLEIGVRREMLEPILDENELRVDTALRRAMFVGDAPFAFGRKPGAKARVIAGQMLANPFTGTLASCYLESKALELLVEEIEQLFMKRPAAAAGRGHARQVREAAGLLSANLEAPLTVAELARHVHLSESTLKRAFRDVYGMSIFGWFQARRMEAARAMLARGDGNVSEVAFLVGYATPGHFARAFARHFGHSPKKIR